MKRHQGSFVLAALGLAILMAGCWGSSKSQSVEISGGGASPIATATAVGIDKCNNCHAGTAVNGVGIFGAWAESRHGNRDGVHLNLPPVDFFGDAPAECNGCHDPNGDSLNLALYAGAGSTPAPRNVVGCEACHGGGSLHFGVGPIGGPTLGVYAVAASAGQSSQYNTCIACHVERDSIHDPSQPFGTVDEIIYDTHFDNATRAIGSDIQGYVIRKWANTSCVDCHDPHSASMTTSATVGSPNIQWKGSAHGDFAGEGWKHYQWTATNRQACQRCHTATGLVNYLTSPATYDQTKNVFPWLTSTATDNRSELLYCWGCHTDYYGGLRNPGPITASYSNIPAGQQPVFPDLKGSNICMACHSGRENGDSIKFSTANFRNLRFVNSHYLTAGATLFGVSGYENAARTYDNVANFEHPEIGTAAHAGTGSNGPCVGCHMTSWLNPADPTQGKHKFLNVGLDNTGTDNIVTTAICAVCHDGIEAAVMDIAGIEAARVKAEAGLAVLDNALRSRGFYFGPDSPYFFTKPYVAGYVENGACAENLGVKNWNTGGTSTFAWNPTTRACDSTALDNGAANTGKDNMGAAFNYNLFAHDPGFFVHNSRYPKLLIYDAIDWLDGAPDNSVQTYINTYITDATVRNNALAYFGASGRP